jgi:hypothetical protein
MSQTVHLVLGGTEFRGFEVPEEMGAGGSLEVKTFRLAGGAKRFHVMGVDERPMEWSGRFRGPDAQDRANAIDGLFRAMKPVTLTWAERAYTVLIVDFGTRFQSPREILYSIHLEVVTNDTAGAAQAASVGPTQMINGDLGSAAKSVSGVSALSGALSGVTAAVGKVRDFAQATQDQLNSVLRPVLAARAAVDDVFQAAETVMGSVSAVGGVVPGLYARDLTGGLLAQVEAARDGVAAFEADAFLGRMETNLQAIGTNGSVVTIANGNLFSIAQRVYGDAAEWSTIARANGLLDPDLIGAQDLVIPPNPQDTGGVLNG